MESSQRVLYDHFVKTKQLDKAQEILEVYPQFYEEVKEEVKEELVEKTEKTKKSK